jgi:hypothetical protein
MEYPVAQGSGVEALVVELVRGPASGFSIVLVSDDDVDSLATVANRLLWRISHRSACP